MPLVFVGVLTLRSVGKYKFTDAAWWTVVESMHRGHGVSTPGPGHGPDEDNVSLSDVLLCVSAEEEVAPSGFLDHFEETGLVDRQVLRVPGLNALLVNVHNNDLNFWAHEGNHGHGWATDVASSNAGDLHFQKRFNTKIINIRGR